MQDQLLPESSKQKFKSESFITKVVLNVSISCILIGYSNAYFSSIDYDDFVRIFQITQHKAFYQGFITGLVPLTAGIGGFIASFLLKKFSRVNCFLVSNLVYSLIIFGLMFKSLKTLVIFRLIQGFFTGIFSSIVPLYIKQFSPLQLNGKMGTFFQMLTVFGLALAFFVSFVCSIFFPPDIYWRIVFIFPLFLICFQSYNLLSNFRFQTPKYLLSLEKIDEARQLLKVIYKEQFVDERLQQLRKMLVLASNKNIELKEIRRENRILTQETETYENVQTKKFEKKDIEYHNNKLAVYAAIHISTLQQFSGISIVIGYGAQIIKRVFPSLAKVMPIFLHLEAVIACFFTIELLKNHGRKTLAQYGCLSCGICTLVLGYTITTIGPQVKQIPIITGVIVLVSLFGYRFVYGVTIGPISFLYIPQIVEPNIMPIIIIIYWFSASLTMMLFPIIRFEFFEGNPGPLFIFFAGYTLLSILINHYVLVETKGKKQYEVRMEYDRILGIEHKQQIDFDNEKNISLLTNKK